MAKFLVTYLHGDMPQDRDSIAGARRELVQWAARTGHVLIDAGTPIRSTMTLSRDGCRDTEPENPLMGWSVIDAADRQAAVRLLGDHPLIALGAVLQISEPV